MAIAFAADRSGNPGSLAGKTISACERGPQELACNERAMTKIRKSFTAQRISQEMNMTGSFHQILNANRRRGPLIRLPKGFRKAARAAA
ncbi:MAG: hypothetical protein LBW85_12785 [Deltaproteobacteria bacterium]|jgi:hypothetical protein|nr:hypothetical protein [Deltaproteobacteria bacterium]